MSEPSVTRNTVLAYLDGLSDDAAAHIYPSDLEKCMTSECVVEVASVRAGNGDESTVPLFSREQVVAALAAAPAQQPWQYTSPAQEHIQAQELEVRQLTEQNAGLRGALIEIVGMPTSHATVPVRDYVMQDIAKAELAGTAPAPMPSPTPQADSRPAPPKITAEDRSFLHDNPNTDDIVKWVQDYARAAISADRATHAPADSVLEDAARYRWLRNKSTVLHNTAWLGGATAFQRDVDFLRRDDALAALDATIDAARKQGATQ